MKRIYLKKCNDHFDSRSYMKLQEDPTERIKREARTKLEILRDNGTIDQSLYLSLKPTDSQAPKIYGLPKIYKASISVRPIVSYSGSPPKYIANILKPYSLLNKQQCKNSKEFSEFIRTHTIKEDETMVSFDVEALCTNVLIDDALEIMKELLENNKILPDQTPLSSKNVLDFLDFCYMQHSSFSVAHTTNRQKGCNGRTTFISSCRNLPAENRNNSFNNNQPPTESLGTPC